MAHHWILKGFTLLMACFWCFLARSQDERFYRQILSGELPGLVEEYKEVSVQQYNVQGPIYRIDINGDGIEEGLVAQKRDGVDWIEIRDSSERKVFEAKLWSMGAQSVLYKIKIVTLSPQAKTLILFLDEGLTKGMRVESTARIFLISFEKGDLNTMKLTVGPHFYHEYEATRDQYSKRQYRVDVLDLNHDGQKEVIVHFNHIQRILFYEGQGQWSRM